MEHAFLSPSGAKLDMHCPGNRWAQAEIPRTSSKHSANGTGLHCLAAHCLVKKQDTDQYIGWWCGETSKGADFLMQDRPPEYKQPGFWAFEITPDDAYNVQIYIDHVRETAAALPHCVQGVELKLTIDEYCWGTGDSVIVQPYQAAHVSDYKNGFTYVDETTPQLKLYLIGAIGFDNPFEIPKATATIVQPKVMHAAQIRSVEYPVPELFDWYHAEYAPAAALCMDKNARRIAGAWCKDCFCDARHTCPELAAVGKLVSRDMFTAIDAPKALPAAEAMTVEQRIAVLERGDIVIDWIKAIKAHEYALALQGKNTWGKLVKGKNSRSYKDDKKAEARLNTLLHGEAHDKVLKSPAKAEKALQAQGLKAKDAKAKIVDLVKTTPGDARLVHVDAPGKDAVPGEGMFNPVG